MYTLGVGRILIQSIIIVCFLNPMAWKAGWAHRTGENGKKDNDKIKKSFHTSSACVCYCIFTFVALQHGKTSVFTAELFQK